MTSLMSHSFTKSYVQPVVDLASRALVHLDMHFEPGAVVELIQWKLKGRGKVICLGPLECLHSPTKGATMRARVASVSVSGPLNFCKTSAVEAKSPPPPRPIPSASERVSFLHPRRVVIWRTSCHPASARRSLISLGRVSGL